MLRRVNLLQEHELKHIRQIKLRVVERGRLLVIMVGVREEVMEPLEKTGRAILVEVLQLRGQQMGLLH